MGLGIAMKRLGNRSLRPASPVKNHPPVHFDVSHVQRSAVRNDRLTRKKRHDTLTIAVWQVDVVDFLSQGLVRRDHNVGIRQRARLNKAVFLNSGVNLRK